MPHRIENQEETTKKQPTATQEDHEMMLVRVERTPMGSRQPVHTVNVWREVLNPALKQARLAEERRIAKEKQDKENARLDKNAKARVRRHLNKVFDSRVAIRADGLTKNPIKTLRRIAKEYKDCDYDIDTKGFTTKKQYAVAIATTLLKMEDEECYSRINRNNADRFIADTTPKGDAQ